MAARPGRIRSDLPQPLIFHVAGGGSAHLGSVKVVKASDAICWRQLEGRPCLSSSDRQHASAFDVVVIPIANIRRRDMEACPSPVHGQLQGTTEQALVHGAGPRAAAGVQAVLSACYEVEALLNASGVRVTVDDSTKSSPGECLLYKVT